MSVAGVSQTRSDMGSPGFGDTLASEWTKLRSVRSTWVIVFLALALSIGLSTAISLGTGLTYDRGAADAQPASDPLLNINFGLIFGIILLKVLGVTSVTSEYGSRMIRTTFIATPDRLRVVAAKTVIVGATGVILTTIMVTTMFLINQAVFRYFGLETLSIGDRDIYQFLGVYAFVGGMAYTLIPLSIAFLLRSTASAVTIAIGVYFLPTMLGAAMPAWVQENVLRFLPDVAMDNLAGAISNTSRLYASEVPALMIVSAWLIGGLGVASLAVLRRDA